jgi:hypothetical protein
MTALGSWAFLLIPRQLIGAKKAAAIEFCKNKNIEDYILMIDQIYLPD